MHVWGPFRKQSASSSRWLARQARDPFVKQRGAAAPTANSGPSEILQASYRSRSAFKLVSLARKYPQLIAPGKVVVDLGAAPGGWSQVAAGMMKGQGDVWALDILGMEPIDGVHLLQGNFLRPDIQRKLVKGILSSRGSEEEADSARLVDTVLSDMMAPMSGLRIKDIQASLDLVSAAASFAKAMLRPKSEDRSGGGNLVMKYFAHPDLDLFRREELEPFFRKVIVDKPKESRPESSEAYWVCLGFQGMPR